MQISSIKLITLLSLLFIAACADEKPLQAPTPRYVESAVVKGSTTNGNRYPGQVRAADRSDLSFEIAGKITSLLVDLGEDFKADELLATVDNVSLQLAADALQSDLNSAQAVLAEAKSEYQRRIPLVESGAISKMEFENVKTRFVSATAALQSAQSRLSQAKDQLDSARLIAPFAGEVVERLAEPSQVVAQGQAVLRVIASNTTQEVVIAVPENALGSFTKGAKTQIYSSQKDQSHTENSYPGTVIESGANPNVAGLYPITIALSKPTKLNLGQRVEVGIEDSISSSALSIPLGSYRVGIANQGEVFKIDPKVSKVTLQKIQLGEISDTGIEVLSGLSAGDRIVTKGVTVLRDGDPIIFSDNNIARYNQ